MNTFLRPRPPETWRSSVLLALGGHLLLVLFSLFLPGFSLLQERDEPTVRMVRLAGGGENKPGWVKPTPAPPDEAPVPDARPVAVEEQPEPAEAETHMAEEVAAEESPVGEQETVEAPEPVAQEEKPVDTGAGIGAKPGPEGTGIGAVSDTEFAGSQLYLSRIEAEIQRRFNYRGRSGGSVAVYHFYINRNGEIEDLVLTEASEVSSLNITARSALLRCKFPPLPRTFPHERLSVSCRFIDE